VNRTELIDEAAELSGLGKGDVGKALDGVLKAIEEAVSRGDKVSLTGFGTFERRERAARTGRNPQTGESMEVAASKAPAFKPGKSFKDAVNQ
jgi:DNA-binding protein HU-beta